MIIVVLVLEGLFLGLAAKHEFTYTLDIIPHCVYTWHIYQWFTHGLHAQPQRAKVQEILCMLKVDGIFQFSTVSKTDFGNPL